jgi:hypothetical protein
MSSMSWAISLVVVAGVDDDFDGRGGGKGGGSVLLVFFVPCVFAMNDGKYLDALIFLLIRA